MITTPSNYMQQDRRFRNWAKLVTAADIDLTKSNGYSLNGSWIKWSEAVSLTPGRYLIVASEQGSSKYHSYKFALIDGATGTPIDKDTRIALLDLAMADGRITEDQRVAAKNSTPYAYALYISLL